MGTPCADPPAAVGCGHHRPFAPGDLWSKIKSEGMPDTTKHGQSIQVPRHQEPPSSSKPDPSALARLLDEWMHGDETEQQETFEVLRRSLDEDRPEGYKLFS